MNIVGVARGGVKVPTGEVRL